MSVASRRKGDKVVLSIAAEKMNKKGYKFYLSENDVWLTDSVPAEFIISYRYKTKKEVLYKRIR